jgi:hypothetical protein
LIKLYIISIFTIITTKLNIVEIPIAIPNPKSKMQLKLNWGTVTADCHGLLILLLISLVAGGYLLFFRFMGNFMEVNTAFDWAGRAIVTQNGNAQRAALSWASNDFTQVTKDFCKKNPVLLSFNSFIY